MLYCYDSCPTLLPPGMHCVHLGLVQWANGSTIHLLNDYKVFSGLTAPVSCAMLCTCSYNIVFQLMVSSVNNLGGANLSEHLASMTKEFNRWCQSQKIRTGPKHVLKFNPEVVLDYGSFKVRCSSHTASTFPWAGIINILFAVLSSL